MPHDQTGQYGTAPGGTQRDNSIPTVKNRPEAVVSQSDPTITQALALKRIEVVPGHCQGGVEIVATHCTLVVGLLVRPGVDGSAHLQTFGNDQDILDALESKGLDKTVDGLLELTQCYLAGQAVDGVTGSDLVSALSSFNEGFHGGRTWIDPILCECLHDE